MVPRVVRAEAGRKQYQDPSFLPPFNTTPINQPNQLVPLGWMQTPDESGRLYYVNLVNGVTSWNRPTQHAKEPAGAAAAAAATGAASTAAGGAAAGSAGLVKSTSVEFDEPVEAPPVEQEVTVVEIEGRQFAVDASGKITYMDNFWVACTIKRYIKAWMIK